MPRHDPTRLSPTVRVPHHPWSCRVDTATGRRRIPPSRRWCGRAIRGRRRPRRVDACACAGPLDHRCRRASPARARRRRGHPALPGAAPLAPHAARRDGRPRRQRRAHRARRARAGADLRLRRLRLRRHHRHRAPDRHPPRPRRRRGPAPRHPPRGQLRPLGAGARSASSPRAPTLLVTCDCGSSDHERLAAARARGIDAVVIDHHLVPAEPLPAYAFLNPHRPECGFPYKGMASCGLALSLGAAVRRALGVDARPAPAPRSRRHRHHRRRRAARRRQPRPRARRPRGARAAPGAPVAPGLRALAENARIDLAPAMRAEDVAFRIAPRLNAPGRLGDPDLSLQLLLEQSPTTAVGIAAAVEQLARAAPRHPGRDAGRGLRRDRGRRLGAARPASWWRGAAGTRASSASSPGASPRATGGPPSWSRSRRTRGAARCAGPAGSRLHDALTRCRHELVGFGGHQAAAGVEVRADRVERAARRLVRRLRSASHPARGADDGEADVRLDDRDDPTAVVRDLVPARALRGEEPRPAPAPAGSARCSPHGTSRATCGSS